MSLPAVLFADLELEVCTRLKAALDARSEPYTDNVYVGRQNPLNAVTGEPERRTRQVTVRRDGGPRLDRVRESARIGVNVYAETPQICNNLALMVEALLTALPDGAPICRVDRTSGLIPIEADAGPQVYMTLELIARGADLA